MGSFWVFGGKQKSLGAVMEKEKWTFRRCVTSDFSHGQLDCCSVIMADESGATLALPVTLYSFYTLTWITT